MVNLYLATDASGLTGMGGFYDGRTFSVLWPDLLRHHQALPAATRHLNKRKLWPVDSCPNKGHINYYKELYALWWCLLLWGPNHFRDKTVTILCDNTMARCAANNTWTKANGDAMRLVRHLTMYLANYNTRLHVVEIAREQGQRPRRRAQPRRHGPV